MKVRSSTAFVLAAVAVVPLAGFVAATPSTTDAPKPAVSDVAASWLTGRNAFLDGARPIDVLRLRGEDGLGDVLPLSTRPRKEATANRRLRFATPPLSVARLRDAAMRRDDVGGRPVTEAWSTSYGSGVIPRSAASLRRDCINTVDSIQTAGSASSGVGS